MSRGGTTKVELEIENGPNWVSHIEVSRDPEGLIVLTIMKHSGADYGSVFVEASRLKQILDFV